jgi:hypothetical protein
LSSPRSAPWQIPKRDFHRPKKFSTNIRSRERRRFSPFWSSLSCWPRPRLCGRMALGQVRVMPKSQVGHNPLLSFAPLLVRVNSQSESLDTSNIVLSCVRPRNTSKQWMHWPSAVTRTWTMTQCLLYFYE